MGSNPIARSIIKGCNFGCGLFDFQGWFSATDCGRFPAFDPSFLFLPFVPLSLFIEPDFWRRTDAPVEQSTLCCIFLRKFSKF